MQVNTASPEWSFAGPADSWPEKNGINIMKKLRKPKKVRVNIANKRAKRALRSKAKRAHRQGTGFKDIEE